MCGLVGIAGDFKKEHLDAFNELLVVNQFRGGHSTGVASVPFGGQRNHDIAMIKKVGGPHNLFDSKRYDNVVNIGKKVLIGHGRHSTVGATNEANAHPFQFRNVVGAHNGTLEWGYRTTLRDAGVNPDDFGTDSEALYAAINEVGPKEALALVKGAWALTFYTPEDNRFRIIRNKERPLCYAFTEDRKVMFVASEASMLTFVLNRKGIKRTNWTDPKTGEVIENCYYPMPENAMYSWEVPPAGKPFPEAEITRGVTGDLREDKKNVVPFFHGRGAATSGTPNYLGATQTTTTGSPGATSGTETTDTPTTTQARQTIGPVARFNRNHLNQVMTPEEFKLQTQGKVCSWCDAEPVMGHVRFYERGAFFCDTCVNHDGLKADEAETA